MRFFMIVFLLVSALAAKPAFEVKNDLVLHCTRTVKVVYSNTWSNLDLQPTDTIYSGSIFPNSIIFDDVAATVESWIDKFGIDAIRVEKGSKLVLFLEMKRIAPAYGGEGQQLVNERLLIETDKKGNVSKAFYYFGHKNDWKLSRNLLRFKQGKLVFKELKFDDEDVFMSGELDLLFYSKTPVYKNREKAMIEIKGIFKGEKYNPGK